MRVIAFHTSDDYYAAEAARFAASLDAVGMKHDIQAIDGMRDWYTATAYKAEFCLAMRRNHRGPLLYIDVDAIVHSNCTRYFSRIKADIGVHYFQGPKGGQNRTQNDNRLLSGTIWLGDTKATDSLLQSWCYLNRLLASCGAREGGGQKNLWYLLTCFPDIRIHKLPGRYCYVFDKPWAYPDDEPRIIEHLIASRENRGPSKGKVNGPRQQRLAELEAEKVLQ